MKILKGIALLLALAVSAPSGATQTTFITNAGTAANSTLISTAGAPAPLYCDSSGCKTSTTGLIGPIVTITAWSTPQSSPQTNSTTSPTDTGTWLPAYLAVYGSNGIGISNTQQGANSGVAIATETLAQLTCASGCPSTNPEHVSNAPQHAIDNNGVDDILVVDFGPGGAWDVNSFSLGYTCNASTGTCGGAVAVEAWIGGTSTINFATESFSANNNLAAVPSTGGFTRLSLTNDPLTGGIVADPGTATGRYLVITGALGSGTINGVSVNGYSDSFKVSQIVASTSTTTQTVPSPGSLPLLGLGLLALTLARRRLALIA